MKVLIACEESGIVRGAFKRLGHDAWSCDLLDTAIPGKHLIENVLRLFDDDYIIKDVPRSWDLMIAFPPCTHLAVSGARWFKYKGVEQHNALSFVKSLMDAPINKICIENPISIISTKIRKPDQIIQPWMFGHGETKATCLWLKNLPLLKPTKIVEGRDARIHKMPPSKDRSKLRSKTYSGIAKAMAEQWGNYYKKSAKHKR